MHRATSLVVICDSEVIVKGVRSRMIVSLSEILRQYRHDRKLEVVPEVPTINPDFPEDAFASV